jgi:O-antigen/teichoic acid export membrane protein
MIDYRLLKDNIFQLSRKKFSRDVVWTFVSRIIMVVSGIVINIVIGNHYQPAGLGIFNQSLSLYFILAVLCGLGIPNSTLKYSAEHNESIDILPQILMTGLFLVFVASLSVVGIVVLIVEFYGHLIKNDPLCQALQIIVTGLPFFVLNKVQMFFLNGLRRMRLLSILQTFRWILIISFIIFAIQIRQVLYFTFFAFLFTETCLFIVLIAINSPYLTFRVDQFKKWYRAHLSFGSNNIVVFGVNELCRRIDILMIGFFLGNSYAGLYSFAATIAFGLFYITGVVQSNFNPIVSNLWAKGETRDLQTYIYKIKTVLTPTIGIATIVMAIAYPILLGFFMKDPSYKESYTVFYILLFGISVHCLFSGAAGGMLAMAGFLKENLYRVVLITVFNIAANAFLIPLIGIIGAAIATSSHFILNLILLRQFLIKYMDVKIM